MHLMEGILPVEHAVGRSLACALPDPSIMAIASRRGALQMTVGDRSVVIGEDPGFARPRETTRRDREVPTPQR